MKRSVLVVFAVLLTTGGWGEKNAQAEGNVYSNKFVGLSFSVPENWYIATDSETEDLMQGGARIMDLDDPSIKPLLAQMPSLVLLVVSEQPLSNDVQNANPNIMFMAINARDIKDEVSSGADYLGYAAQGLRESLPDATISSIVTQSLGGEEFHRFNARIPMQGITVLSSQFARIHNDYIVILGITAASDNGLTELVEIADMNLRLSAVSQEVDSSPEGAAFREESSLNTSGSKGGNWLRNLGILLIIIGVVRLINILKGKKKRYNSLQR